MALPSYDELTSGESSQALPSYDELTVPSSEPDTDEALNETKALSLGPQETPGETLQRQVLPESGYRAIHHMPAVAKAQAILKPLHEFASQPGFGLIPTIPEGPEKPGPQQMAAALLNPVTEMATMENLGLAGLYAAQPELGAAAISAAMAPGARAWWEQFKRLPQMTPAEGLKFGTQTWLMAALPFLKGAKPAYEPVKGPVKDFVSREVQPDVRVPQPIEAEITPRGGEEYAQQPSYAQVEGGEPALGVETRPSSEEPPAGGGDYALGEAQGEGPRGNVPGEEPVPEPEPVVTPAPSPNEPEPVATPETFAPAELPPEEPVATEPAKEPATFKVQATADDFGHPETSPLASYVMENGGLVSKAQAKKTKQFEGNKELWDGTPVLAHPTHNKIWQPTGEMPDVMASNAYDAGLIKEPTVDALYKELQSESKSARTAWKESRKQMEQQGLEEKQYEDFQKQQGSQSVTEAGVPAKDLEVGDKVYVADQEFKVTNIDDNHNVTIEDGRRFGVQTVRGDEVIYGEHVPAEDVKAAAEPWEQLPESAALGSQESLIKELGPEWSKQVEPFLDKVVKAKKPVRASTWDNLFDEPPEGYERLEDTYYPAKGPKAKAGAKKEGLLPAEEVPFNLRGEKPPTGELTEEGAARRKAEIAAEEKKTQGDLFSDGIRLKNKAKNRQGGFVDKDVFNDVLDFGRRVYGKGMEYAQWASRMVRHLGEGIRQHLRTIWDKINELRGGRTLPGARESGEVGRTGERRKGFHFLSPAERALHAFREEARAKGFDPEDPQVFKHWKQHMESLPEHGETLSQHDYRVPRLEVTQENYNKLLEDNQLLLAKQMKQAAFRKGVNLEGAAPKIANISIREPKTGKVTSKAGTLQEIEKLRKKAFAEGHEILPPSEAFGSAKEAKSVGREWEPQVDDKGPEVNAEDGGTKEPPPPGSALGPTPPGSNPDFVIANRLMDKFQNWWEEFWPRTRKMLEEVKEPHALFAHQQLIADHSDFMNSFSKQEWWKDLKASDNNEIIRMEHNDVNLFRSLVDQGMHPNEAWNEVIKISPLKDLYIQRKAMEPMEDLAARELSVDKPKRVSDPYIARITNEGHKKLVDVIPQREKYASSQIRKSIGIFDSARTHATMQDGIAAGTQYEPVIRAVWQREKVGMQLRAFARAVRYMRDNGVLHDSPAAAMAASKKLDKKFWITDPKDVYKVRGMGGRDYYARNRQEAKFVEQNFGGLGEWGIRYGRPLNKMNALLNTYARNPNLGNPLPHVTKNMLFKYILFHRKPWQLARDWREFRTGSNPKMLEDFNKYFPMPESDLRIPQLTAREVGNWAEKVTSSGLKINNPSQKFIFQMADPAMRYSLFKHYVEKGMSPEEAAGNTWIDLVRYDENSGGLSFWKSIPLNWFAAWRTGTYVTMFKAMKQFPIKTTLLVGGLEYLREMLQRKYLVWTHLPIDYLEGPLAQVIDELDKARKRTRVGTPAWKAYPTAGLHVMQELGMQAAFGPGGGQGPDMIVNAIRAIFGSGSAQDKARAQNMFWGISQIYNLPVEFRAWQRDGNPKHIVMMFASALFGTHSTIKYEPRRLGSLIPESFPGMKKSPDYLKAQAERDLREQRGMKATESFERRRGVTRGWWQGPEEQQWQDLARSTGRRPGGARIGPPRERAKPKTQRIGP